MKEYINGSGGVSKYRRPIGYFDYSILRINQYYQWDSVPSYISAWAIQLSRM